MLSFLFEYGLTVYGGTPPSLALQSSGLRDFIDNQPEPRHLKLAFGVTLSIILIFADLHALARRAYVAVRNLALSISLKAVLITFVWV